MLLARFWATPSECALLGKRKFFAHRGRNLYVRSLQLGAVWRWSDVTFEHKKRGLVSVPEPLSGENFASSQCSSVHFWDFCLPASHPFERVFYICPVRVGPAVHRVP